MFRSRFDEIIDKDTHSIIKKRCRGAIKIFMPEITNVNMSYRAMPKTNLVILLHSIANTTR